MINNRESKILIPFEVSARAGKLLGRENFSNPEGAINELVKNSYDADAKNCLVFFNIPVTVKKEGDKIIETPIKEDSVIYIIDNGVGMASEIIRSHWMQIGTGNKEQDYLSDEGRIKTGAKGIGRFALDRLGFNTEMWTLPKKEKNNIGSYWKMDWTQFDDFNKSISEIEAELMSVEFNANDILGDVFRENNSINTNNFSSGTIIKITNLKDEWYETEIKDVFKSLEALIPPKQLNIPFEVSLKHIQKTKEYGNVETAFFNDYDYKLFAKYNAETLSVDIEITRNELDVRLIRKKFLNVFVNSKKPFDLQTIEEKTFNYSKPVSKILKLELDDVKRKLLQDVGNFDITFFYLKLTNSKKEGYPTKTIVSRERRATLERFGGVKIYRDSFRVRPYGDPNNDWLRLGYRAAQSPAGPGQRIGDWRVRPESTAGIITISRKTNPLLIDKSDRGALQENDAFETFKKIITGIVSEFEYDRSKVLNPFYKENKKEKERQKQEEIQKKAEELATQIVEKRKDIETSYGKSNKKNLFDEVIENEEKKAYEKAFKQTYNDINDKNKDYEEIVQVRSLASLGLVVSSFSHELKEVKNNYSEIVSLEEVFEKIVPFELKNRSEYIDGLDIIELLKGDNEKIKHWVDYSITAIRKDKRKREKLILSDFFKSFKNSWNRIFKRKDIKLDFVDNIKDIEYDFRAFEMDITTIFSNLINNSIDSFERREKVDERKINIQFEIKNNRIEIIYKDNGTGINDSFEEKDEIFLPFTTTKRDRKGNEIGTGLGMYLVKSVIDDNNGTIDILEPEIGFSAVITFPIRK